MIKVDLTSISILSLRRHPDAMAPPCGGSPPDAGSRHRCRNDFLAWRELPANYDRRNLPGSKSCGKDPVGL